MNNEQNKFYSSISKYYSEIFPYNPMQLQFVKDEAGELIDKHILDIGCATGELAFALAKEGAAVIGIDLNEDLLEQAVAAPRPTPKFKIGNMLELANDFENKQFDTVLCFGNTLVHLQTKAQILQMLKGVFKVLKPSGKFLMQILNYDYILDEQVAELPLIETDNIKFTRHYKFEDGSSLIRFQTDLLLKPENRTVSNETTLYTLKSKTLNELFELAGFQEIAFYSNFKKDAFGGKHIPLVVRASVGK